MQPDSQLEHPRLYLTPTQAFDHVEVTRRLKIFPVDFVDASPDLGDGPERLYAQLFRIAVTTDRRKNPWPGYVYASENFLVWESRNRQSGGILPCSENLKLYGWNVLSREAITTCSSGNLGSSVQM
jgi:hypothetical protein